MLKIKEILIGTNNPGKYSEICALLPDKIIKHSPRDFKLLTPPETGKSFKKNSLIKASYFSKKTNLVCLSDDSGLEIDILNGKPGIYSSRWGGKRNNFNLAIKKVFKSIEKVKKNRLTSNKARFICCLTVFWPNGQSYSATGILNGKLSNKKKGNKGFGYDPIFIPKGYKKTFGEMDPSFKIRIDHRHKAYNKIRKFFI
tara:strand:- start:124 stop:720 length:597 start_codon:yes stop_codon:yes gene_type:complete